MILRNPGDVQWFTGGPVFDTLMPWKVSRDSVLNRVETHLGVLEMMVQWRICF